MERKGWFVSIGLGAAMLASAATHEAHADGMQAQAHETPVVRSVTSTGDVTGEGSCSIRIAGFTTTGYARVRIVKSGSQVTATVTEYRIVGASSGRNKANVDHDMRIWDNAAGTGDGKTLGLIYSADAMRQDGQWHTLNQSRKVDPGFDVKRAHVGVRFTFDMAGGDPTCWVTDIGDAVY